VSSASVARLSSYVEALRPIIFIQHFDFEAVDALIAEVAGKRPVHEYSDAGGRIDFRTKASKHACDLPHFLSVLLADASLDALVLIKDPHFHLQDPRVLARLRQLAARTVNDDRFRATVFLVSEKLTVPPELDHFISVFEPPRPGLDAIRGIIDAFAAAQAIRVEPAVRDELAHSFKGFSDFEITQMLNLAYQTRGGIGGDDLAIINQEKEQTIRKSGMLEVVNFSETMADIGGLEHLKAWLRRKARIFAELDSAVKAGVDVPRGIVIVGMPGCGKSLTAKAAANLFEVPLLRLDVGKLFGKYVGDSEENMRRTLAQAEAVSPCVLWIDEIEKAFAGVGDTSGHEVTNRLFGYFLTWVQEKESAVFVIATANDLTRVPPEFLRKGRFDELFSVSLPNPEERRRILEIHLRKRGHWSREIDTLALMKETEGYSGADLEAIVKEAIENAFIDGHVVTTARLSAVIKTTKSLKQSLGDKLVAIEKALVALDVKPASGEQPAGSTPAPGALVPLPDLPPPVRTWYAWPVALGGTSAGGQECGSQDPGQPNVKRATSADDTDVDMTRLVSAAGGVAIQGFATFLGALLEAKGTHRR
jgi:ATP-dependent 26S proteasome regulatory subunit